MSNWRKASLLACSIVVISACAAPAGGPSSSGPGAPDQVQPSKILVVAVRGEPPSLVRRPFRPLGLTADLSPRMFNADLTIRNDQGVPVPYLAESVPQLNTDTWKVNPDGTMVTAYRLKAGAKWHDGQPLTADDFVFSYEVYSKPDLGMSSSLPMNVLAGVTAADPRTLVLNWKTTYPHADGGSASNPLNPLPRHILGQRFLTQDADAFLAGPFWTREYVGAGPFKLDKWETGSFLEAVAFDGDVFGKPKIPRVREIFIPDPNTVLANILSGEAQLTAGDSIRFTDGETLRQQWGDRGKILNFPNLYRIKQFQWRPEFASTRAFTDLRVRQALANGINFPDVNEAIQAGRADKAVGPIPPTAGYFAQLDKTVAHFPYDPRKSEQLMLEAGFTKGSDGVFTHANPQFGRMSFEDNVLANPDSENEMHIIADGWRKIGFDIREIVWIPAIASDNQQRSSFPGISTTSSAVGEPNLANYKSDRIPSAERRWTGSNFGGWPGLPEYDRLVEINETSLDRNARTDAAIQMSKIYSEILPVMPLYFKLNAVAVLNGITGPRLTDPNGTPEWNIQEWDYK